MTKSQNEKVTEIFLKNLEQTNKEQSKQHYLNLINEILTPLLEFENTLLNDKLNEFLTPSDFYDMIREATTISRGIKITKFNEMTLNEYIQEEENKTT